MLIEDHALIGDMHTAALVAKDGAIDFLCLPDFDSEGTFVELLGNEENGHWKIAPSIPVQAVKRRYLGHTLVLETEFQTAKGTVRVVDFMPVREGNTPHLVRRVECVKGEVPMKFDFRPRFASGLTVPRQQKKDGASAAVAGPDAVYLRGEEGEEAPPFEHEFTLREGEVKSFVMSWARPYDDIPRRIDAGEKLAETQALWEHWAEKIKPPKRYADEVIRSLLTLRACTYKPSGAIVAAPTFGLPETPGGGRNWDYRFCWVRDSSLTLNALMRAGLIEEARAFGKWLVDAIGGAPGQLQIMYGIRGERRLTEIDLDWLNGYGGARPVRIGNGAYTQFQLDVLGEFSAVLYVATQLIGKVSETVQRAFKACAERVAEAWRTPDHGIWEMRGPEQHFVASKVSAWTAVDRWVKVIEEQKLKGEGLEKWRALRKEIFDEVCSKGYDPKRNTFTQYYGSKDLDASLLFIPMSGFLPATDPRVVGTVKAIEEDLIQDGFVLRYRTQDTADSLDGLSGEEGVFLACSFWLADTYHLMGRKKDAEQLFEKLAALQNDVGLLAEEYLPKDKQQIGNFPQAFSHLALINCAYMLTEGLEEKKSGLHMTSSPV